MTEHVLPRRVEIYDTTLRDGSQLEGISLTVDDKLRIAEQLDWLGVALHRGAAGPAPTRRTTSSSGARRRSCSSTRRRSSPSGRPAGSKGKVDSDDTLRHLVEAERRHGLHRRQVVGLPRARGARHHARRGRGDGRRLGRVPARRRAWTCCSTPSTSSTATSATPSSRCACSRRPRRRAQSHVVLCDTNGGSLPHEVERIVREVVDLLRRRRRRRRPPPRRRRHRRRQRDRRRARRRDAGAGHDQRLRRAHRQLQPHRDHPEPHAEDGHRDDPGRSHASGSRRSRTTSPSW